jgi:hypothetical protein
VAACVRHEGASDVPSVHEDVLNDGSRSAALFCDNARQLGERLGNVTSPRARELEAEAARLAALFERWELERPEGAERVMAIKSLFDLQREAMTLISKKGLLR